MTAKEMAELINGREYGDELRAEEIREAKENGLVIVYGYSDDCAELNGAICDEAECFDGGAFYVTKGGILRNPRCGDSSCKYFRYATKGAREVMAVWCSTETGASWSYKTDIPHETFNIYDDGELYCIGIVFSINDI